MNNRVIIASRPALSAVGFIAILLCASWGRTQSCTVSAVPLDFGTYLPGTDLTVNSTIDVGCTAFAVRIDRGSAPSFTPRTMKSADDVALAYNLFVDAAFGQIWGDGTGGTVVLPTSGPETLTVHGKIPLGQAVAPGFYSDTVIITVEF